MSHAAGSRDGATSYDDDDFLCYSAYLVNELFQPGPLFSPPSKRLLRRNAVLMRIDDAQPSSAGACAKMGVEDRK